VSSLPDRRAQAAAMRLWRSAMRSARAYGAAAWMARRAVRLAARLGLASRLPGPARAWASVRELPVPPARSFRQDWAVRRTAAKQESA
jgi:L-lactate dehydrogenase complex protein LldF